MGSCTSNTSSRSFSVRPATSPTCINLTNPPHFSKPLESGVVDSRSQLAQPVLQFQQTHCLADVGRGECRVRLPSGSFASHPCSKGEPALLQRRNNGSEYCKEWMQKQIYQHESPIREEGVYFVALGTNGISVKVPELSSIESSSLLTKRQLQNPKPFDHTPASAKSSNSTNFSSGSASLEDD